MPNVLAGIIIGWANNDWVARILASFGWGYVWCAAKWIINAHEDWVAAAGTRPLRWRMRPWFAYYFIEYTTAFSTALTFAFLAGFLRILVQH